MTEDKKRKLLATVFDGICADKDATIGPVLENLDGDHPGIWLVVRGQRAFLGTSFRAAMFTGRRADWWIPKRDGKMLLDDIQWFERRSTLPCSTWERHELPMFKEERRTRLAMNIQLATGDGSNGSA